MEKYLTTAEAAQALNVTQRSVFNYLQSGKLKGTKTVTGIWRIPASEIERFLGIATIQSEGETR